MSCGCVVRTLLDRHIEDTLQDSNGRFGAVPKNKFSAFLRTRLDCKTYESFRERFFNAQKEAPRIFKTNRLHIAAFTAVAVVKA